jgi:parallel beta-helix repeat protein
MTLRGNGGGTILTYNPNKSNTSLIRFKNKITSYEDVMWDDTMQRVPIIADDNNITIRNLVFDGQLISDNNASIIECGHSNNIKILNNVFRSIDTWNVIELYHSTQVDISNNIFNNIRCISIELVCDDMYDIYNHYYQHIDNIIIKDNFIVGDQSTPGISGIKVSSYKYNLDNINIIGNIIRNFKNGIDLYKALRTNISNNTCKCNEYGIHLESSDYNNISNNISMDNTKYNIYLPNNLNESEHPYCNYNLIANNYIYGKNYVCGGGESNTFVNNKYE